MSLPRYFNLYAQSREGLGLTAPQAAAALSRGISDTA
jgi:hypothetical protein